MKIECSSKVVPPPVDETKIKALKAGTAFSLTFPSGKRFFQRINFNGSEAYTYVVDLASGEVYYTFGNLWNLLRNATEFKELPDATFKC